MSRIYLFCALLSALPLLAQAENEGRGEGRNYRGSRDAFTSGGAGNAFRQLLTNELKSVPTLGSRVQDLLQIQQEKFTLLRIRKMLSDRQDQPSDVVLREFHDTLRQEDELTSREQTIVSELKANAGKIQDEIARRRDQLDEEMDRIPDRKDQKPGMQSAMERRRLQRLIRLYDFLSEQIEQLKSRQGGGDWIRKIARDAWPPEELDPHAVEQTQRKLQLLMQEQQEIRRRMQALDEHIQELHDVLNSAPPRPPLQENRRPGPNMPGRDGPPRNRPEPVTPPQQ